MHGESQTVSADLKVVRYSNDGLMVVTNKPIILRADQFGMADGVEKLREVVGLPSISLAVPVSLVLSFTPAR
jgi:hypothetical protein